MNSEQIITLEDRHQLKTYHKAPIAIVEGNGLTVTDAEGKTYLDFYSGHAVTLTGHCHPHVVQAIQSQAERLIFYSNIVYNDMRAAYSRLLAQAAPDGIEQAFFCNSGAEANETALKIARRYTGRTEVIAMERGFHGRTVGALSATGMSHYREMFAPLLPGTHFAPFGDLDAVEALLTDATAAIAAVLLEPIQSIAGVRLADAEYYQGLRALCDAHGAVLIFDEVQTGFGRTGTLFAGEHWDVVPDIITSAKGIASGFPMGATLVTQKIAETISYGEQGTTFGGGPLACAAAKATLETILEEDLVANAAQMGDYIKEKLAPLPGIEEVRGLGLLLGLETVPPARDVCEALREKGFLVGTSGDPHVLRLMPPLIVRKHHVNALTAALGDVMSVLVD
ncbi:MAG: aspartate aminotransferase family protein [Anaerolineae bacterium]